MILKNYKVIIKELKSVILASRYRAAALANKELLVLYFSVGRLISDKSREGEWGTGVLEKLSEDLQKELPGLRGFGSTNLKRMRIFYEAWNAEYEIRPLLTDELKGFKKTAEKKASIRPLLTDELMNSFSSLSFTHHSEILAKVKELKERIFYIQQSAINYWSVTTLQHQIKSNLFKKKAKLPNNFNKAITNEAQREKALQAFKDEYLLDFINIEDPEFADEKEFENQIVRNIRKFILSIGTDFAFIGNQYRLVVEDEECFVDLLFFNRKLQSLVAFELKKGKFKPEYLGKMNFYLSALDEMVKQPHENPSVGIILCKSKTDKVVEFSFRDFNKAMGVATYKTSKELPAKYKGILPDARALKKLLG
ncbi:PDDEXK nuclease domain-containing protein [Ferruginibacter sp. SUN106]|uniref:PDDEXK nuclease domain-containing protein n=1 Tax=Ferruginibacter sp. SUN106 TaxID=2978348 RepID=UPI003D3691E1